MSSGFGMITIYIEQRGRMNQGKTKPTKVMIWTWAGGNLVVLIPKKRGSGFLKTPYWHNVDPALEDIRDELGGVDIFGLDGHLEFVLSMGKRQETVSDDFAEKAIALLEAHYGYPSKESYSEFFENHPVPTWEGHEGFLK